MDSACSFKVANVEKRNVFVVSPNESNKIEDIGRKIEDFGEILPQLNSLLLKGRKFAVGEANCENLCGKTAFGVAHGFVAAALTAYNEHLGLELRPDDFWAVIAYGVSQHLGNETIAENYRGQFVAHQGKKTLCIENLPQSLAFDPACPRNKDVWSMMLTEFKKMVKENTKTDISTLITAPFSTSGNVESAVFSGLLMETMKQYFEFRGIMMLCGIPEITLHGSIEDYKDILTRIEKLTGLLPDFSWWLNKMHGYMVKVYESRKGNPDIEYWQRMIHIFHGSGSLSITGWLRDFIPYTNDRKGKLIQLPNGIGDLGDLRKPALTCTDITLEDERTKIEFEVKLLAGFVGISQAAETGNVRPALGWMIFFNKDH